MPAKSIPNYDGLYGDVSARPSAEYIFLELIATRSQNFDWVIQPHIHAQLFQVFVVKKGRVTFQEATQTRTLEAPCVLCVPPTHLHGLTYTSDVQGHILTVSAKVVEAIFQTSTAIFHTFEKIQTIDHFEAEWSFENIERLMLQLETELFNEHSERYAMLRAYLTQFFVLLHRLSQHDANAQNDSLAMQHFRRFQKNIKTSDPHKTIPEYAAELNITPVHLNRICKATTGRSAIELVNQNLIQEAQKYLLHTSYSVSEIAYLLQFEYPNYFAKLFKKYTGVSPVAFREQRNGQ